MNYTFKTSNGFFIQSGCYNFVKSVSNLELDFKNSPIVATKDKGSSYFNKY